MSGAESKKVNPLDNIKTLKEVKFVMKEGKVIKKVE